MDLVLFDLDNTLLCGDSDFEWGRYVVEKGLVSGDGYRLENQRFFREYQVGTLDPQVYLEFVLKPLAMHDMQKILAVRALFFAERIPPLVGQKALDLVKRHKQAGNLVVVITATNRFITEFVFPCFNVSALIAPEPEIVNGRFTGRTVSIPCFGSSKVSSLKNWLAKECPSYERSWFYSDSINDLPLLEWVDNPIVVNGDPKLLRVAIQRGWQQLDLCKPTLSAVDRPQSSHGGKPKEFRKRSENFSGVKE